MPLYIIALFKKCFKNFFNASFKFYFIFSSYYYVLRCILKKFKICHLNFVSNCAFSIKIVFM
jgi:hypothetical protein